MSVIKGNETPNIEQVIRAAIEGRMVDVHTMLPGQFESYDAGKQTGNVKLLLKRKYADGTISDLPVLVGVPVVFPRTKDAYIHLPVKSGDNCMVLFSERSLDIWKKQGGSVDPQDPRKFHLSDAVAIPGLYSNPDKFVVVNPDNITIKNKDSTVEVFPTGKYQFKGSTDELMDLLVQVTTRLESTLQELNVATTNTVFGAMQLNNFASFAILKAQVTTLKTKLTDLKGA